MRIVALVPGGIGDQILFFPTLEDLKTKFFNAEIDVVAEPKVIGAYRVCQSVQQTIPFDFKASNSPADWANLLGVLRDRQYTATLSLGRTPAIGLLLWLTGIPTRVGYASATSNLFLTKSIPLQSDQYAAAMYHDLLQGFDINTPCSDLSITIPRSDLDWAEMEQKRLGIPGGGYVLIHGGSSERSQQKEVDKVYPVEKWQAIIQDFQTRQPELPLVVLQGTEDDTFVAALLKANPGLKVSDPDDIGKLAAMIAGANLMLCTDSAPMHLAVALKVYTLALFGPTDPAKLLPKGDRFLGIKSPTGLMADIDPKAVLSKVWGE